MVKEIARTFKMSRKKIRKYRYYEELPRRNYPSPSGLEKHLAYINSGRYKFPNVNSYLLPELTDGLYPGAYSSKLTKQEPNIWDFLL